MFNPFNLLSTVIRVIFKLQIRWAPQALSLHSPTLKPVSGFPLLSLLFHRQIMLHLILRTPAFFLLLEYASKCLWNGLTNTWDIISAEFSDALVNPIRTRTQHWFWTGRRSMARRFQRPGLSGKQLSSVLQNWAHTQCPAPLSSFLTSLDPSTHIKMRNCRPWAQEGS